MRSWLERNLPIGEQAVNILQGIAVILVAIFTACWTYDTFAHTEKMEELKKLKAAVEEYHDQFTRFCAKVPSTDTPDDRELGEKLALVSLHNKLVNLAKLNLYVEPAIRQEVQDIVGSWFLDGRIRSMQRGRPTSPPREESDAAWENFNAEYEEVVELIDKEAARYR